MKKKMKKKRLEALKETLVGSKIIKVSESIGDNSFVLHTDGGDLVRFIFNNNEGSLDINYKTFY